MEDGSESARGMGPTEFVQAVTVARRYYLEDRSKVEIAAELGISRYRVARILARARAEQLVRIDIAASSVVDAGLSTDLHEHLGLEHCIVADGLTAGDVPPEEVREIIGRLAAGLLTELVVDSDVLGISWGRSVHSMVDGLSSLARCDVVQMTGVSGRIGQTSIDVLRRINAISHGRVYPIYAPMIMQDRRTTTALKRHPMIAAAVSRYPTITKAVVAIGSWDQEGSQMYAWLSPADRESLRSSGAVAEVCAQPVDSEGRLVSTDLTDRMIAIGFDQLRAVPEIIAVAGGAAKAQAIRAVVRSGIVTSLVTDQRCAEALLELEA